MRPQSIKLNLVPGGVIPVINVSQYDVGRPLEFVLWDGKSPATIEEDTVIDIRATKPDGHGFQYTCTWENNVVSVTTQIQMTVLSGSIECELHLEKNSTVIGTANFILEVEQAALRSDTDISETELPAIIDMARSNQEAAAASAAAAAESESNAADSETAAAASAAAAAESESNAADSETAAASSETNAASSATAAGNSATAAAASATNAASSATAAANSKKDAEAYAVGKRDGVDVASDDVAYNNNAKYYAAVAQAAAAGGIIPKGTCTFATLPSLASSETGDMWNISDDFTTTSDFREGAGVPYGAGANVYKTGDGKWDVTSGQMIMMQGATASTAGTPGAVEGPAAGQQDHYWTGGAIWKNDTSSLITNFTSSDDSTETGLIVPSGGEIAVPEIVTGANHGGLFAGLSKIALNSRKLINTVKRIWNTVANAWVSGVSYAAGQVVTYTDGHTYICKLAHTSSSSITPANTTYWEDKTLGDMISSLNSNYANSIFLNSYSLDNLDIQVEIGSTDYTTTRAGIAIVKLTAPNSYINMIITLYPNQYYLSAITVNSYTGGNISIVPKGAVLKINSSTSNAFGYFRPFKI